MKIDIFLRRIKEFPKAYYRLADFEKIFGAEDKITVQKSLQRLVDRGVVKRLIKDVYVLGDDNEDLTKIANLVYRPSYLSFESVLFGAGVIDQPPFGATFATTRRSKKLELGQAEFWFSQIKPQLWWGFSDTGGILQADPEKAAVDMLYLRSRGQRNFGTDDWYLKSLNRSKLRAYFKRAKLQAPVFANLTL